MFRDNEMFRNNEKESRVQVLNTEKHQDIKDFEAVIIKSLIQYNLNEIKDFMKGSGVKEEPCLSKDFERRLQETISRYNNAPNL